ncbi:class II glutamine amidotransferase [Rubripirellula reticaptiva]|uniref:Glucosamine--fructose-6-phosphate aminotransferase n=1 Tax=Rubripirellula reticaptiva TaxID=2528013 RepID=A0A5C6F244_9BACT|nr:class II glutamine amidotransferase [Rubripirellula reticaptiva]TWU55883.1 glucosamine--fructose-6-phosphate aminotransferase [Rubripirellula reticaptiva]
MCRLYGFRANEPTKVECTLVHAQNALLLQSQSDELGRAHPDGWGIGYFEHNLPMLEKHASAAFHGLHFSNTAERVYSESVVSHVRLATVGTTSIVNCHPFQWGGWICAHNGTVTAIKQLRDEMLSELSDSLRCCIQGETDSELLFHWLMDRFLRSGAVDATACVSLSQLTDELAKGVLEIDRRCQLALPAKPAKLNVVLTDGRVMVASRFRNSLCWVHRDGIRDCEICGIPHVAHTPGKRYHAVVIASEPVSHEAWEIVPDGTVISVDQDVQTATLKISQVTAFGEA